MGKFIREFKYTETLSGCYIFEEEIKESCLKGEFFPAIRDNKIDFYYNGGRLFRRTPKTYVTNRYYSSLTSGSDETWFNEQKDKDKNKKTLINEFNEIKKNCFNYYEPQGNCKSEKESHQVSKLFNSFSFLTNKDKNLVLIDIEARLGTEGKKSDKIDLVFYVKKLNKILFVEVKDRFNKEARSKTEPAVKKQIERYEEQIENKTRKKEILDAYKNANKCMESLFKIDFGFKELSEKELKELDIYNKVPLLIVGNTKPKSNRSNDEWLEPRLEKKYKVSREGGVIVVDGRDALNNKNFKELEKLLLESIGIKN